MKVAGGDLAEAALALADIKALKGRGQQRLITYGSGTFRLIDESYNASPASMRAAFQVLKNATPAQNGRRIAVLGDMLELGSEADTIHAALAKDISSARIDIAILAGNHMAALCKALPKSVAAEHGTTSETILPVVINTVRPGDVVTVKGSLGSRMALITAALAALDETKERQMLYNFLVPLADDFGPLNLFRYITFRTGGAIMTALIISFIFGPSIISWLKLQQGGASNIREDVPEGHLKKPARRQWAAF